MGLIERICEHGEQVEWNAFTAKWLHPNSSPCSGDHESVEVVPLTAYEGAVDALAEAREYVAEAVARREDMGLRTSAAHELLTRIDGGGRP